MNINDDLVIKTKSYSFLKIPTNNFNIILNSNSKKEEIQSFKLNKESELDILQMIVNKKLKNKKYDNFIVKQEIKIDFKENEIKEKLFLEPLNNLEHIVFDPFKINTDINILNKPIKENFKQIFVQDFKTNNYDITTIFDNDQINDIYSINIKNNKLYDITNKQENNFKYELIPLSEKHKLYNTGINYQIKALKDIPEINVKKDDYGGFVNNFDNLSKEGNCWIFANAKVFDNAKVLDNTLMYDNSELHNNSKIFNNAELYHNSKMFDNTKMHDNSKMFDNSEMHNSSNLYNNAIMCNNAIMYDNSIMIDDSKMLDNSRMYGNSKMCNYSKMFDKKNLN